ncbi:MAG: aminotransferase class I/II-fold pyridoxal phosphate-dependent enzyme [Rhodospirillaceae bacterium]|jgi:aspartate/methionine/tyrosine aminotransferase|nr:aminotransferase class I/II-fold pyridoxal phosphate-dependent enzyme [Rhodospirillaceae bacterium]
MALKVAARGRIDPFIVMEVMRAAAERAASGADVVHLEVGQPSTRAPRKVLEAAKAALDTDLIGYTLALGIPQLRERIARHYREFYGAAVPAERIVVTTGSSGGFLLSFLTAFAPGDRVALASPGYPCYRNILTALGIEPVIVPMEAETKFQPNVAALERVQRESGRKLDGLIVASPSNPVGAVVPEAELRALMAYCRERGIRFVSDEIYHGITYGVDPATAAAIDEQAIVINSFSKYFSMTGWRLGWMVVPADLLQPIERLAQNLFISPPTLSQYAGLAAFDAQDECRANVRRYADNRALLLNELPGAGFDKLIATDGAFYIYADVARLTNDSVDFCRRMLLETGVAATPGVDFDAERGRATMRFSFAGSTADMAEAVKRLKAWRK